MELTQEMPGETNNGRLLDSILPPPLDSLSLTDDNTVPQPSCLTASPDIRLPDCLADKSPISALREECMKSGLEPQYELVASEGPVHQRIFTYRVTVGDRSATASGRSKKKARHACAAHIVQELYAKSIALGSQPVVDGNGLIPQLANNSSLPLSALLATNSLASLEPASKALAPQSPPSACYNAVGKLQEFTQMKYIAPPMYEFSDNGCKPHEREYKCVVRVAELTEYAMAKTKKAAKQAAADILLRRITMNGEQIDRSVLPALCHSTKQVNPISLLPLKSTYSSMASHDASRMVTGIRNLPVAARLQMKTLSAPEDGRHCNRPGFLSSAAFPMSCLESLQEVADARSFEVTYVDIPELAVEGQYQCLVQLSTLPVVVCHGVGASKDEARTAAALNALRCLRCTTLFG